MPRSPLYLYRCPKNGFGPGRCRSEIARLHDFPANHVKQKRRLRNGARVRIGIFRIVVDAQFGQVRHELNQVETTAIIPLANSCLGNIVATLSNPRADACDVKFRASQTDVPDAHFNGCRKR